MRVESFTSTNGLTRYILVDSSGVPIDAVLKFLRFKDNCGRARNTLRAYCFHLKSYFEYLESIGMTFSQIGMDELAGFIRWLQGNHGQEKILSFPPAAVSKCSASTINVYLSTIYAFYDYLSRHEEYRLRLSDMLRHSSLSELRRLGWPVEQLRIRAGHHFVQSTYVYLHTDDEELRQEWIRTENQMLLRKD